jgi:hypothetical protein
MGPRILELGPILVPPWKPAGMRTGKPTWREPVPVSLKATRELGRVAFGTNCRSAPVPFIFLRHYCTQMRVDLFCFLDAAEFFGRQSRAPSNPALGTQIPNPLDHWDLWARTSV